MVEVHISLPVDTVDALYASGYLEYNRDFGYYKATEHTSAEIDEFLDKFR